MFYRTFSVEEGGSPAFYSGRGPRAKATGIFQLIGPLDTSGKGFEASSRRSSGSYPPASPAGIEEVGASGLGREGPPATLNLAKASVLRGYLAQLAKGGQLGATLEVGLFLCGTTGAVRLVEVLDGGAAARFDVRWS